MLNADRQTTPGRDKVNRPLGRIRAHSEPTPNQSERLDLTSWLPPSGETTQPAREGRWSGYRGVMGPPSS